MGYMRKGDIRCWNCGLIYPDKKVEQDESRVWEWEPWEYFWSVEECISCKNKIVLKGRITYQLYYGIDFYQIEAPPENKCLICKGEALYLEGSIIHVRKFDDKQPGEYYPIPEINRREVGINENE